MIKYEITERGKCKLEVGGYTTEIGCDAAYMIALIYKDIFITDPAVAARFRRLIMEALNDTMDAIERGEFKHDDNN